MRYFEDYHNRRRATGRSSTRRRRLAVKRREKVREMLENRMPRTHIAKALGVSVQTVYRDIRVITGGRTLNRYL